MTEPSFSDIFDTSSENGDDIEIQTALYDAAAAGSEKPEGVKEQKFTDSAQDKEKDMNFDGETQEEPADEKKKSRQTKEENAKYAAARRKAERERDRALEEAREQARVDTTRELEEMFADAHMVNPYTQQPIRSVSDFLAWKEQFDSALTGEEEEKSLYYPEEAGDLTAQKEAADNERMRLTVENELSTIRQWDPSVQNLMDLPKNENFTAIYDKVKKGYSISDAFYLVNAQRFQGEAVEKAKQATRNHLLSKDHLGAMRSRGGGEISVPGEVMAEFRRLMPKASSEEIRRFYQKDLAQLKRKQKG